MRIVLLAVLLGFAGSLASCQNVPGADGRYASHNRGTIYDSSGRWAP
jgi:hypothetical protein